MHTFFCTSSNKSRSMSHLSELVCSSKFTTNTEGTWSWRLGWRESLSWWPLVLSNMPRAHGELCQPTNPSFTKPLLDPLVESLIHDLYLPINLTIGHWGKVMRDSLFFVELFEFRPHELPSVIGDQHPRNPEVANDGPPYKIYYFRFHDTG